MVILHLAFQVTICGGLIILCTHVYQRAIAGRRRFIRHAIPHYDGILGFMTITWAFAFFWLISAHFFLLITEKPIVNLPFLIFSHSALAVPFAFPIIIILRFLCLLGLLMGWLWLWLDEKRDASINEPH